MAGELKSIRWLLGGDGQELTVDRDDLRALFQLCKEQHALLEQWNVTGPCPRCCFPYPHAEYDARFHSEKGCDYQAAMNRYKEMGGE